MTKTINVSFPDWMYEEYIEGSNNKSQRIQQLVQKGTMVETLEDATGQSFKQLVRGKATGAETRSHQDDPDGIRSHRLGCLSNQWSEFIYNNPWTAKTLGETKS